MFAADLAAGIAERKATGWQRGPATRSSCKACSPARAHLPVQELVKLVAQKSEVQVDCAKLIGCDDEIAAMLADLLSRARKQRLAINLVGAEVFMDRLNERLLAGEAAHEAAWRLLLELLQRHGTQERFEERAVDYAITFELSPPSWERLPKPGGEDSQRVPQQR